MMIIKMILRSEKIQYLFKGKLKILTKIIKKSNKSQCYFFSKCVFLLKIKSTVMTTKLISELVEKYGKERTSLLPILQEVVNEERYLSEEAIVEVAKALDISSAEVFGTASFYSFLDVKPRGKYIVRICQTIVCDMHGKQEIIETLEKCLGIKCGETTADGKFSLLTTNCLGWCHKGPAMLINDDVYTELTPNKVREIIKKYKLN
jgi:NADH-quinone oxidoreductase E subunit